MCSKSLSFYQVEPSHRDINIENEESDFIKQIVHEMGTINAINTNLVIICRLLS